jgi:purine-binding chemotaxis protein CheW
MSNTIAVRTESSNAITATETQELLTVMIGDQIFGIPILQVQDVLGPQRVTRVPLAPAEVVGSLNLRGRIVTAIHIRERLHLPRLENSAPYMSIVVEYEGEFYSLIFDRVGDVLKLSIMDYETCPSTLDPYFRDVSDGIYRLKDQLLVVLDVPKLLSGIGSLSN